MLQSKQVIFMLTIIKTIRVVLSTFTHTLLQVTPFEVRNRDHQYEYEYESIRIQFQGA